MKKFQRLSEGPILIIEPALLDYFSKTQSVFIKQLDYWIQKGCGIEHEGKKWIYNTSKDWGAQIKICERQVKRVLFFLGKAGIISIKKLSKNKSNRTNYITLNYDKLNSILSPKTRGSDTKDAESSSLKSQHEQSKVLLFSTKCKENHDDQFKDILSPSSGQNVPMVIQNKLTKIKNTSHAELANKAVSSTSRTLLESNMQNEIVKKMIEIWNSIVEEGRGQIVLTNKRTAFLKKAFSDAFQEKLDNWKQYCEKIASSQFLMGKVNAFKATLDFALKFETIQKISEGQYGVKEIAQYVSHVNPSDMAIQIKSSKESEKIRGFRLAMLERVGALSYKSWFSSVKLDENENHTITMETPTSFIKDYISQHYRAHLKSLMEKLNIQSVILSKNGNGRDEIITRDKKEAKENILKDDPSLNNHGKYTMKEEKLLVKEVIKEFISLSGVSTVSNRLRTSVIYNSSGNIYNKEGFVRT